MPLACPVSFFRSVLGSFPRQVGTERVKPRLLWYVFPQMPAEQGVGPNPVPMAALGACGPQGQVSSSSFSTGVEGAPFMHFTLTLVCFFVF